MKNIKSKNVTSIFVLYSSILFCFAFYIFILFGHIFKLLLTHPEIDVRHESQFGTAVAAAEQALAHGSTIQSCNSKKQFKAIQECLRKTIKWIFKIILFKLFLTFWSSLIFCKFQFWDSDKEYYTATEFVVMHEIHTVLQEYLSEPKAN